MKIVGATGLIGLWALEWLAYSRNKPELRPRLDLHCVQGYVI